MRARGSDFFIMSLAYSLGMTRRLLLLNVDSYELSMWRAFFEEMNRSAMPKRQTPAEIDSSLRTAFAIKTKRKKNAKSNA